MHLAEAARLGGSSGLFQKRILDQTYDNGDDRAGDTPADGLACRRRDIEAAAGGRASESRNHRLQELAAEPPPTAPPTVLAIGPRSIFLRSPPAAWPPTAPAIA